MKLKLMLLVCSVFITDFVYSQNESKWSLGLYFSPDICYRTLSNHDESKGLSASISSLNKFEIPKLGYSTGFIVKRTLNDKFSLESGIGFNDKGYQSEMIPMRTFDDPDGINATAFSIYHFRYLTIPIKGLYSMKLSDRWKFQLGLGVENNFYIDHYRISYIYYKNTDEIKDRNTDGYFYNYTPYHLMATGNLGFEYSVNNTISLRAEPTFRYALSTFVNEAVYGYFWSTGISLGCLVKW